jgi:hypothetical protein
MEMDPMTPSLAQERISTSPRVMPLSQPMADGISYVDEHLEAFLTMARPGDWPGRKPNDWVRHIEGVRPLASDLGNQVVDRADLKAACLDTSAVPDRDLLWAILSWGGIRIAAARRLARNEDVWSEAVGRFRREGMTRAQCFLKCFELTESFPRGGIGPAFFTKLIFFANPSHDGYIMDQWTSRSVNLLVSGPPVVLMRTKDHVDPRNTADHYERFCQIVEDLSGVANKCDRPVPLKPEDIERCLFSTGHPKRHQWRKYVVEHG